jgi:hypothetical protein
LGVQGSTPFGHVMPVQTRFVMDAALPGLEIRVVFAGALPSAHTQQGSPSSKPFVWPSPSLSFVHSETVHCGAQERG